MHAWIVHDSDQQRRGKGNLFLFSINHEVLDNGRFYNPNICQLYYRVILQQYGSLVVYPLIPIANYSEINDVQLIILYGDR